MRRGRGGPVRAGTVLDGLLERHGIQEQIQRMQVVEAWPDLVGEQIARATRAKGVEGATLFVEVRSSAWMMELNMMKGEILARVNARVGDVPFDRVVFVLAEV